MNEQWAVQLKEKKIIVTGSTTRYGAVLSRLLVTAGARVACLGAKREEGYKLAFDITARGDEAFFQFCDFAGADESEIERAFAFAVSLLGGFDGLVNIAESAVENVRDFVSGDFWNEIHNREMKSISAINQTAIRYLKREGGGIVHVLRLENTTQGEAGERYIAGLGTALTVWTQAAAENLEQYKVQINSILVGSSASAQADCRFFGLLNRVQEISSLKLSAPADLMKLAAYLLFEEAGSRGGKLFEF